MAGRKKADPLAELAEGVAADHALAKAKGETKGQDESATEAEPLKVDGNVEVEGTVTTADIKANDVPPVVKSDEDVEAETDAVFDRRLERLCSIVDEAAFDSGTAVGDIRDVLRELFKTRDKPWHLLDANQRKDLDNHLTKVAQQVVRKVVVVVAEEDFDTLQGTMMDNFSVKGDALEVKLKLSHVDPEVLLAAYKLAGKNVVVINASDHKFGGARRPNDPGEQQAEIPFADPPAVVDKAPAPVEHPDDDSDLAGEGKSAEQSEELKSEAEDPDAPDWAVYDADGEVYLAANSEDDPWTDDPDKAMRFTLQAAKDKCVSHGEGMIVQRHALATGPEHEGDAAE